MKLIYQNSADSAAIGANPAMQATLPASNLQTQFREEVARSTSLVPQDITLTWPTSQAIQAVVLYRCNLSAAAQMRLRVYDTPTIGPARTNLALESNDFSDAVVWGRTNIAVTPDAIAAYDGTLTADKIQATSAASAPTWQYVTLTPGQPYAVSVYLFAGNCPTVDFGFWDLTGSAWASLVRVTLSNGTLGAATGYGVSIVRAESAPGGWWRVTMIVNVGANTTYGVYLYPRDNAGSQLGDYFYACNVQIEPAQYVNAAGAYQATTYMLTTTAIATASGEPTSLRYDSGFVSAAFPKPLGDLVMGVDALGATYFDGWGYSVARLFLSSPVIGRYAVITIVDPYNVNGYVQASRLFVGPVWTPTYGPAPGGGVQWNETTVQTRTEGGSIRSEPGASYRTIRANLMYLPESDRQRLSGMLGQTGMRGDVYVSLFPGLSNALERDTQMQGKLANLSATPFNITALVDQQLQFDEV